MNDLTEHENDSIRIFAEHLFHKNVNNLDVDKLGLQLDDSMETEDIFCMLLELVLYGLNIILPNKRVFDLDSDEHPIIDLISKYLASVGIKLVITEVFLTESVDEHLRNDNYYCLIRDNIISRWTVLNYKLQINFNPNVNRSVLKDFSAYFIGHDKLFSISFDYKLGLI